jgi:acetoin utilization deacetylase AcuC-like enzyme
MRVFYSDHYTIPLPEGHRFPIEKYRMLRDRLLLEGVVQKEQFLESPLASIEELLLAHTPEYVYGMKDGTVTGDTLKRLGFPWSEGLFLRSCATVGGALGAIKHALVEGISGNLAGGTHHAHADRGEGYCVFNDLAVGTRFLHQWKPELRVAIIDLDVHQGNGNSSILGADENVFIFSMHGEKNYPFVKVASHLDIGLPDGSGDEFFLEQLQSGMKTVQAFDPEYIFYQAGVDPLKEDRLGRMNLSHQGLMERDSIVLEFAKKQNIPISLALGGGYANPIEPTVQAYVNTYRVVNSVFNGR